MYFAAIRCFLLPVVLASSTKKCQNWQPKIKDDNVGQM